MRRVLFRNGVEVLTKIRLVDDCPLKAVDSACGRLFFGWETVMSGIEERFWRFMARRTVGLTVLRYYVLLFDLIYPWSGVCFCCI
jgi:hypothetical protein